ncbi:MAG TPA: GNAT family N-acetyltransferase, partial [Thermomicrobiales bacterium]
MQTRPFATEADYAQLRRLLVASVAEGYEAHYCTIGDLDWWRYTDNDPAGIAVTQLWFTADGTLVGCAWPVGAEVILLSHPRYRAVEGEMLAWAEARRRERAAIEGAPLTLSINGYDGDATRLALLRESGYRRSGRCYRYRRQALDRVLDAPTLPSGYAVRHLRGEDEVAARVAVHRAAFAPSRMTVEKHRAVMAAPTYRRELDLVVTAPDGSLMAYALVWFDAENRMGVFEPVGTDPAYQRRGLGRAVLTEGLRRLRALGAQIAYINTNGDNGAANRLYDAVGFR